MYQKNPLLTEGISDKRLIVGLNLVNIVLTKLVYRSFKITKNFYNNVKAAQTKEDVLAATNDYLNQRKLIAKNLTHVSIKGIEDEKKLSGLKKFLSRFTVQGAIYQALASDDSEVWKKTCIACAKNEYITLCILLGISVTAAATAAALSIPFL